MSAAETVPQPDDFDAAVDAYVDGAAQPQGTPAPAPAAAPPQTEAAQPATATQQPTPAATSSTQEDDSDDEALDIAERFTRAQKREQRLAAAREAAEKAAAEARRQVLSYQGNLKQEAERRAAAQAERDEFKRQLGDENQRFQTMWEEAYASAPETSDDPRIASKDEIRQRYQLEKRQREIDQKEQAQQFTAAQQEARTRQQQEETGNALRAYATTELPLLLDQAAQGLGLPPDLIKPVKEYVDSPYMRKLAATLPLFPERDIPGDPASWTLDQIGSVHQLRLHLQRQAELGLDHFRQEHEKGQVAANVKAATQTYQQEKPIGAAPAKRGKEWADMDEDEALDAWFAQR